MRGSECFRNNTFSAMVNFNFPIDKISAVIGLKFLNKLFYESVDCCSEIVHLQNIKMVF